MKRPLRILMLVVAVLALFGIVQEHDAKQKGNLDPSPGVQAAVVARW